jgi:hypothetical protein
MVDSGVVWIRRGISIHLPKSTPSIVALFFDLGYSPKALEVARKNWGVVSNRPKAIEATRKDWRVISNALSHMCKLIHEFSLAT